MDSQTAFFIAQGISVVTTVVAILCMQLKKMNAILICQLAANLLAALTYLFLDGKSGVGISIIAVAQTLVMFLFERKGKKPHPVIIGSFIAAYVGYSVLIFQNIFDLLPLGAAICFALGIAQKKPSAYRIFGAINPLFWLAYDVYTMALVNIIMHSCIFISAVVGIVRLDIVGRRKSKTK